MSFLPLSKHSTRERGENISVLSFSIFFQPTPTQAFYEYGKGEMFPHNDSSANFANEKGVPWTAHGDKLRSSLSHPLCLSRAQQFRLNVVVGKRITNLESK